MSETIKKIYNTVTNALDLNQSILSGCIDIVVVEQPNGTLKSSPFHLRFGKFQALRGRDATIEVYINDQKTDVFMKLGKAGEGYFDLGSFQKELKDPQTYLTDDAFSEIDNASMSEDDSSQYQVDKQSLEQVQELLEGSVRHSKWKWIWGNFPQKNDQQFPQQKEKKSIKQVDDKLIPKEKLVVSPDPKLIIDEGETGVFKQFMGIFKEKKERVKDIDLSIKTKQAFDFEIDPTTLSPNTTMLSISPTNSQQTNLHIKETGGQKSPLEEEKVEKIEKLTPLALTEKQVEGDKQISNEKQTLMDKQIPNEKQDSKEKQVSNEKQPTNPNLNESQGSPDRAFQTSIQINDKTLIQVILEKRFQKEFQKEAVDIVEEVKLNEIEPVRNEMSKSQQCELSHNNDVVEISLCSHLMKDNLTFEQKLVIFDANKIVYDSFLKDPAKIVKDSNLMFKLGDSLYQKDVGLAVLLSKAVYGKDLRQEQYAQDKILEKKNLWNRWFGPKDIGANPPQSKKLQRKEEIKKDEQTFTMVEEEENNEKPKKEKGILHLKNIPANSFRKLSQEQAISDTSSIQSFPKRRLKRSLKPNSEILRKLNLNYGVNKITYKVHTELQGLRELTGNIFLFKNDTKIVISDVDGTITRSDVFGQLMPIMGTDWTHPGVAQFYQSIVKNGYQIIYLTARGIGQSDQTKGFIYSMQQGQIQLPLGPVIMSPDRLLPSFKREVIDKKPEVFKIQALKDIKNIFDQDCPMFAGFGNRETDAISYQTVGIDTNKIFIIDTESQIHMVNSVTVTNYNEMFENVDLHFPPSILNNPVIDVEQSDTQNYWYLNQETSEFDVEELFK